MAEDEELPPITFEEDTPQENSGTSSRVPTYSQMRKEKKEEEEEKIANVKKYRNFL